MNDIVTTKSGRVSGTTAKGGAAIRIFKGIPYAKAPAGDLRWRAWARIA